MPRIGTNDRYVSTNDIKAAVRGRESEILDNLSIRWRDGRPHISCPYPDHPDQHPSWRWDARDARAFCTCTKADTIFDIVLKLKRVDFDGAKLWIAEVLGREDLIRSRASDKRRQRHDAASLLDSPGANRDDELPFIYLAARLGIELAEMPRPTTPVTGIKALEYFDPPASQGAKPRLVGSWPCAVFGTIAADARKHAHRIYLAPGGQGKADLGEVRAGVRRDPKKSARLDDGQPSPAGCVVIWGHPEEAPHLVLTEGLETGAAVTFALRGDIESNRTVVASAITAGGIEAFVPWSATKSVTVAADRDEAKEGAGHRRGETAARKFASRHHRNIAVHIALPGKPGESSDWLDILLREGPGAMRSGIDDAPLFEPSSEEISESASKSACQRQLENIGRQYPLPPMGSIVLGYRYTRHNEIWLHKYEPEKNARELQEGSGKWTPIASPVGVLALLQRVNEDDAYGVRVVVEDMTGKPRIVDIDRGELAKLGATEVRARLFDAGLRIEGDGESICVQILKAAKPAICVTVVSRPVWHTVPGLSDLLFVTPAGEVIGSPDDVAVELAAKVRFSDRGGSFEGWKEAVRAAILAGNCPHWVLGIAAGFAGVIIDLCQFDTCGINLSGKTCLGKTTGQLLGVSAWSLPKLSEDGLLRSWRSTGNAMEVHARNASGTFLALDEMAHTDGVTVGRGLYALAGGVGKARMRPDTTLRRSYTWLTFVLLSGEKNLEEKVRDDGGQWAGGMAVRFPDVDVSGVNPCVPAETIDRLRQISFHYGHAGLAFITGLVASGIYKQPDTLRDRVEAMARTLSGESADSAKIRAATPFAVIAIAGALAQEFGVMPIEADVAGAVGWAWKQFCTSSGALVLVPKQQAVANIQLFTKERWDVTIKNTAGGAGTNNREAVGWYDEHAVYLPMARLAEAAGHGWTKGKLPACSIAAAT